LRCLARRSYSSQCPDLHLGKARDSRGGWRRCSRRSRAEASLLAVFVHRRHLIIPPPSLAVAIVRRGRASLAPPAALLPRPSAPWGSLFASGVGRTTAARQLAHPSGILYFSFARYRQTSRCSDCRYAGFLSGCLRDRKSPRTRRPAAIRRCSVPSADTRFAVTASVLQFLRSLAPAPGATSLRVDAPFRRLMRSRLRDLRTLRFPAPRWPDFRLSPPASETGGHGRLFSLLGGAPRSRRLALPVVVTRPPLCSGRDTSPSMRPCPRNRCRGFQGTGRSLPAVETVRSGALQNETAVKRCQ
jgi:hypothetical protein